jgi:hypothetical protein
MAKFLVTTARVGVATCESTMYQVTLRPRKSLSNDGDVPGYFRRGERATRDPHAVDRLLQGSGATSACGRGHRAMPRQLALAAAFDDAAVAACAVPKAQRQPCARFQCLAGVSSCRMMALRAFARAVVMFVTEMARAASSSSSTGTKLAVITTTQASDPAGVTRIEPR